MTPCREPRRMAQRRGALTVEFALAAPIFFGFLFGAIELGRLNIVRHVVDNAAYEAARHGIVPGATNAEITSTVNQYLNNAGVTGATITITPTTITESTEVITVSVQVPMSSNAWIVPSRFTGGASVTSDSTLRAERYRGIL